jgi:hypothetical protein
MVWNEKVARPDSSLRLFWLSAPVYSAGVEQYVLDGVTVRMYSLEKTIADCFKFRNKISLEIALEALKKGLAQGCQTQALLDSARLDRVEKVIRPYLEALL